jgi:hypothetical protein
MNYRTVLISIALTTAACGETTHDELRFGALAAELCGEPDADFGAATAVRWRSLAVGSSFTAPCAGPEIPVCVEVQEDPAATNELFEVRVSGEGDDASQFRSLGLSIADLDIGRVAVGRLPLVRSEAAPETFEVRAVASWNDRAEIGGDASETIARRLVSSSNGDGTCTFTVAEAPSIAALDAFEFYCGSPAPGDSLFSVRMIAPIEDPVDPGRAGAAFVPARTVHYSEQYSNCFLSTLVPVCVEVLDPDIQAVSAIAHEQANFLTLETRDGRRFAYGPARTGTTFGASEAEVSLQIDVSESTFYVPMPVLTDLRVPVPELKDFVGCDGHERL